MDGRAEVLLDGGVLRGTDVLKAIALGAGPAMIGKLQGAGLAAGGSEGMARVLENLEDEIVTTMELLGVCRLADVDARLLQAAPPVCEPTEISAFPLVPP